MTIFLCNVFLPSCQTFAKRLLSTSLGIMACAVGSFSFAADADSTGQLTGNWKGWRDSLAAQGIEAEIVYKLDIMGNTTGGIKEGARVLDNLDVIFSFDGEKLLGSEGTSALIHLVNNNGGRPDTDLVGSAQAFNNIEVPRSTAKLYQAWVQQNFLDDRLSFLGGLYDVNSEFYVTESSGLFIHSALGIGTDIAQSGLNGPSIFPYTSVAGRVKWQPTDNFYIQAAVADGVPGDPNQQEGTQIQFDHGDGAFIIAESGYYFGGANGAPLSKVALGGWTYSDRLDHLYERDAADRPVRSHSSGFYVIGEQSLYQEADDGAQGLMAFARLGFADEDTNAFDVAWAVGAVYTGLFSGREEGQLGFAAAGAHNGDNFRRASAAFGTPLDDSEIALELTYSDYLLPWLMIQPDVQYIINPGTEPSRDNALVIGTRLTVNF
jgi:porin